MIRRWLFGDIVSVIAPRVDRGAGNPPTRRSARWLIGIGLFVSLFGGIGMIAEFSAVLERQDATIIDRFTTDGPGRGTGRINKVTLRFEDGDTKSIPQEPLYIAIGDRKDVPVEVDVDPDTYLVDAVYFEGRRYATGRQSAAEVVTVIITALGVFLLLRGIGRRRRASLFKRSPLPPGVQETPP